jgi:hypothetical protein
MVSDTPDVLSCPSCRGSYQSTVCPNCKIDLQSANADRLRKVVDEIDRLQKRHRWLVEQQAQLLSDLRPPRFDVRQRSSIAPPPQPATLAAQPARPGGPPTRESLRSYMPAPQRRSPEIDAAGLRNTLLITGAALLGLAAIAFAAVAWSQIGRAGQAAVLLLATAAAGGATWSLRDRLPATAEALSVVTAVMLLADAEAIRVAGGLASVDTSAYFAMACAVVALGAACVPKLKAPPATAAALGPIALALALDAARPGQGQAALAAALLAAPLAIGAAWLWQLPSDRFRPAAWVLSAGAGLAWLGSLALSLEGYSGVDWRFCAGIAALALAPGAAALFVRDLVHEARLVLLWVATTCLGSAAALAGGPLGAGRWHAVWAAVVGALVAAFGLAPAAAAKAVGAGGVAVTFGAVGASWPSLQAVLFGPPAHLDRSWSLFLYEAAYLPDGAPPHPLPTAITLLVVAAVLMGATVAAPRSARTPLAAAGGATASAAALSACLSFPLMTLTVAIVSAGLVAAGFLLLGLASRQRAEIFMAASAGVSLVAVPAAIGWAATHRVNSLAAAALVAAGAWAGGAVAVGGWRRLLFAVASAVSILGAGVAAAVVSGPDPSLGASAIVVVTTAGALLAGVLVTDRKQKYGELEGIGWAGLLSGLVMCMVSGSTASALGLTVAAVFLLAGGVLGDRLPYRQIGAAASVLATWAWLDRAGVRAPEPYTLPAAAVLLIFGAINMRRNRTSSWQNLTAGLVLAVAPSLSYALGGEQPLRWAAVVLLALAMVVAGFLLRLQAPLAIGTGALLILGLDTLAPALTAVPQWFSVGMAGVILLWLGATAEQRMGDLRRWRQAFDSFERPGESPS